MKLLFLLYPNFHYVPIGDPIEKPVRQSFIILQKSFALRRDEVEKL